MTIRDLPQSIRQARQAMQSTVLYCRQPFLYPMMEELLVVRPRSG